MVTQTLASFALRTRRLKVLVPALIVLSTIGCSHHRKSLRPVFVNPAPACSTPATVMPETMVPSSSTTLTPSVIRPSIPSVVEPSASTLGAPAEPAPSLSPPTERIPSAVPGRAQPESGMSPRSSAVEEQGPIEPVPSNDSNNNGSNSQAPSSLSVPRLTPPGTSFNNGRRTAPARLRKVSLREQLLPYTNNPDDLFSPPKADRPWKYVVLHHSANPSGNYEAIDHEHRKRLGWEGCGYHFVIGNGTGSPDGQVEVARRWSDQKQGIHCRDGKNPDVSEYGIGICLVGDLDKAPPTPRQVAAAQALVAYLGNRYVVPPDHISTHAHLAGSPTACPGKHFPSRAILGADANLARGANLGFAAEAHSAQR